MFTLFFIKVDFLSFVLIFCTIFSLNVTFYGRSILASARIISGESPLEQLGATSPVSLNDYRLFDSAWPIGAAKAQILPMSGNAGKAVAEFSGVDAITPINWLPRHHHHLNTARKGFMQAKAILDECLHKGLRLFNGQ
ncbi:hypothetical protein [Mucilaginibacter boryungensis]|uniref:Uncharacterized protein n=1 Tax=Mucilaginibacter boryungensis TaxID=768480 RepID=A0ABR9XKB6_9SPHI|nr:hypothetical protein [Mucilaginibacter boryungensis]MBE9667642.1 hypothetical protein [Mucilaginibacter boryungensis]